MFNLPRSNGANDMPIWGFVRGSKQYKKHEDLATEMNMTAKDLKKALDRHRKRLANQE
jgi:hypothetical protein